MKHTLITLLILTCCHITFAQTAVVETAPSPGAVTMPVATKEHPVVEQMPAFNGSLNEYVVKNMAYPRRAVRDRIQGTVHVQFIIEPDGSLSNIKIVKSVSPELDAEALRVVKGMPKWKAGKINGRDVQYYYTLPLHFVLQH